MENIKVSVLIYVLNDVTHIKKCLQSVRTQTLKELEILVIDGGSSDGTLEIIQEAKKHDSRIRVIHCESGVGLQFNTGLKNAKGEYIGICESDDYLLPEMIEKQYETASSYQLDMLRANAWHFIETDKGEIPFLITLTKNNDLYDRVLDLSENMALLKLGINSFWSGLYNRKFLLEQMLFMNETKGASYQDTSFSFLTAIKAKRVMLSHDAFYCYRLDNPNSSVNQPKKITLLIEEYNLLKKRLQKECLFEQYKEIYLSWKINGYLGFYDSLSKKLKEKYVELMYIDIKKDLDSGEFSEYELLGKSRKIADNVKKSISALCEYLEQMYIHFYSTKKVLEEIKQQDKVIIFGNGDMGNLVYMYLKHNSKNIVAFIDNNQNYWGKNNRGVLVMNPMEAVRSYPDAVYIVANLSCFDIMKKQLMELSIIPQNIIVCNDYAFFFKHILLKSLKGDKGASE